MICKICHCSSLLHSLPASNIFPWSTTCFWIVLCNRPLGSCRCHLALFPQVAFYLEPLSPSKKEGIIPRAGLTDPILAVGVPIYIIWLTSTVWRAAVSEQWLMFLGAAIFMVIWTISFILVFLWCSVQSGRFLLLSKLWAINPQYQVSDCLIGINLFYTPIPHSQVHYVDIFGPYVILYIHLSVYFELLPGMDHGNLPSGAVPDHNNSSPQQWQCERQNWIDNWSICYKSNKS